MRIRALRVRNVGRFTEPTAVEGLSGALDVLAERNEFGKTTLFRAIEAVFLHKHTMGGSALKDMQPYGGGEPLIEADFDAQGGSWRIRKQFGRGRSAELFNLATGATLARSGEAEDELQRLIGVSDGKAGRLGLLWVGQGHSMAPAVPDIDPETGKAKDRGERSALEAAIGREIETVAVGDEVRRVRAKVSELLDIYMGGRAVAGGGKLPKVNSAFDRALKERDRLAAALAVAEAAAKEVEAQTRDLEALQARRASEVSAERIAAARKAAEEQARKRDAARELRQRFTVADARRTAADAARRDAERALRAFDDRLGELADLSGREAHCEAALRDAAAAVADTARKLRDADAALAAAQAAAQAMRTALAAHRAAAQRRAMAEKLEELTRAHEAAARLDADIAAARQQLAANRATPENVRAVEEAARAVARLEDRLAAAAPNVTIGLLPSARGRVRVGGAPLDHGATFEAGVPLAIEIEGIGTITVAPGARSDGADVARDLDEARRALAARIAALGAATVAEVNGLREERAVAEKALDVARATLRQLAPEGSAALAAAIAALRQRLAALPEGELLADPEAGEAQLAALEARQQAASRAREDAAQATQKSEIEATKLRAAHDNLRLRRAEIEGVLPPPDARSGERARLATVLADVGDKAAAAARDVLALAETVPDAEALEAIERAAEAAMATCNSLEAEAARLDRAIHGAEKWLEGAHEEGTASSVEELKGALLRAEEEVARFEAERRGLLLLQEALRTAEAETRARFVQPVAGRLAPYLQQVFPGATLDFGDGFRVTGLLREGRGEALSRLSDGTREQIAVLVRLAFGRLLADAGQPAPVVLDDALVFSDDERIERMFRAIEAASRHHQVLVLTCRASLFAPLGGKRVTLVRWDEA